MNKSIDMNRAEICRIIGLHKAEMQEHYFVESLFLFGSASRDELREDSDIDLLVTFSRPATLRGFFRLKSFLEDLLQCRVDLVTQKALRPELRPYVEKDLLRVA